MAYSEISASLIAAGRSLSTTLLALIRANFIDHEARIAAQQAIVPTLPPGSIIMHGVAAAISGYLACDGSAVSRATYADLFAVIATDFGIGDGSTTFNVPDLRGRAPMGSGTGSGLTARTRGTLVGNETHTLSSGEGAVHTHGITDPGHTHKYATCHTGAGSGTNCPIDALDGSAAPTGSGAALEGQTALFAAVNNSGGGGAHNNIQPVLVSAFFIKT